MDYLLDFRGTLVSRRKSLVPKPKAFHPQNIDRVCGTAKRPSAVLDGLHLPVVIELLGFA